MERQLLSFNAALKLRNGGIAIVSLTTFILASPALAKDDKEAQLTKPPAIYTELVACKTIADAQQRLACYDEKVVALETAQTNKQVVIADREQVKEARRGLFGLSLPRIKLFGGGNDEGADISQIESTITSIRQLRGGKLVLSLEDGATWQQTEVRSMRRPRKGDPIVIKRAALGSYTAKVKDGRSFKVKRIVR